ncbi:hypothetical protein Tsp_15766 [Trichinella spiralis]|uniref:hypothetical protein n=1 Tax=Trichinella spiralis TaxID=6334 RepID=UPI0001EFD2D3|nr:hypothetical protein Tsp_15766 [Trichinella spiralis]
MISENESRRRSSTDTGCMSATTQLSTEGTTSCSSSSAAASAYNSASSSSDDRSRLEEAEDSVFVQALYKKPSAKDDDTLPNFCSSSYNIVCVCVCICMGALRNYMLSLAAVLVVVAAVAVVH